MYIYVSVVVFFFVPHLLYKADYPQQGGYRPSSVDSSSCPNNLTDNSGEDWRGPFFVSPFSEIISSWVSVISFCSFFFLYSVKKARLRCASANISTPHNFSSRFSCSLRQPSRLPPFPLLLSSPGAIYRLESSCHLHLFVTLTLLSCLSLFANASSRSPSLQAPGTSRH